MIPFSISFLALNTVPTSLEPVAAALTGVLVFGEPMGASMLAGVLCVLTGVYILR